MKGILRLCLLNLRKNLKSLTFLSQTLLYTYFRLVSLFLCHTNLMSIKQRPTKNMYQTTIAKYILTLHLGTFLKFMLSNICWQTLNDNQVFNKPNTWNSTKAFYTEDKDHSTNTISANYLIACHALWNNLLKNHLK